MGSTPAHAHYATADAGIHGLSVAWHLAGDLRDPVLCDAHMVSHSPFPGT